MNALSKGLQIINKVASPLGVTVLPTRTVDQMIGPTSNFLSQIIGLTVVWGSWNNQDYIDKAYIGNTTVYSVVSTIASVAGMAAESMRVYKVKDRKKAYLYKCWTGERSTPESRIRAKLLFKDAYEYDDRHPLNDLIKQPNPEQGQNEFLQLSLIFKLILGNRFWFKGGMLLEGADKGKITELYNLPPQHMQILASNVKLWEVFGYQLMAGGAVDPIPKDLVLHSRLPNPIFNGNGSHLWGLSPLKAMEKTLEADKAAQNRQVAYFQNAGSAGLIFNKSITGTLATHIRDQIRRRINDEVNGYKNAGSIAVSEGDIGYIDFAMTGAEMQMLETRKYNDQKIYNAYHVPAGLFTDNANATDNNIAAWNKQLVSQAVLPALIDYREDWNKIAALWGPDVYVDFDIAVFPELKEDLQKLASTLNLMPYLSPNEKRIAAGWDEDLNEPMMKRYIYPSGYTDISNLNPVNIQDQFDQVDNADPQKVKP